MDENIVQEKKIPLWLNGLFLIVAIFGFADATYLTISHYSGTELYCGVVGDCNAVTTSKYSAIGPIPVALLGALYYLSMIVLTIVYFDSKKETKQVVAKLRSYLTSVGFLASAVFVYLQIFVIGLICTFCMVSAGTSTILFILGIYILKKYSHIKKLVTQKKD
jgi:uncharacterized membrane protein